MGFLCGRNQIFVSTWDGLPYFEGQNVEEWSELRCNLLPSWSNVSGNMSRLSVRVWDVARPGNASILTDMAETSTGDHLPAAARWGYADGNPSSKAPLFLLLHQLLSYLTAVNWSWGGRILDGWKSVIYFVAVYTLFTNQPALVTGFSWAAVIVIHQKNNLLDSKVFASILIQTILLLHVDDPFVMHWRRHWMPKFVWIMY